MRDEIWVEKYRPKILDDFVCNKYLKETIKKWIEKGLDQHLLLYGPAGTGKSTLAKLLVKLLQAKSLILNASDDRGIDVLRDKVKRFAIMQIDKLKIILLDEFDFTTMDFQVASRGVIEQFSKGTRFILTCNYLNKVIDPIQSRCKVIKISEMPKKEMAKRIGKILLQENVKFETDDLIKVINIFHPDMRKIINTLQLYSNKGKLNLDFGDIVEKDFKLKIFNLIQKKDLKDLRRIVANEVIDFIDLFHFLYSKYEDTRSILIIADYLYKDSLVADKEINFMACAIELMEIS